jgi:hypothetical protein
MMDMKRKFVFALFFVLALASLPAFAASPDANVKGLWMKCPGFPANAEVLEFRDDVAPWDNNLSEVSYTRFVDGLLTFEIRRQTIEESELQSPEDVESLIEMRVNNDEIDEDMIKNNMGSIMVHTDMSELAELYTYPCAAAEYMTGQNEDMKWNASLFIFTDVYCFAIEASVAADWADDYKEPLMECFKGLEFVE